MHLRFKSLPLEKEADGYSWEEFNEQYLVDSLIYSEDKEFNRAIMFEYFPQYAFNMF